MRNTTATALHALLRELSSELDLHYEVNELATLEPTRKAMEAAAQALAEEGVTLPEAYVHLMLRIARSAQ